MLNNSHGLDINAQYLQTAEEMTPNVHYSTPDIFATSEGRGSQFKTPRTPRLAEQTPEQIEQNDPSLAPDSYAPHRSRQFRVAPTPFPVVPVTPLPDMPQTPFPTVPITPLPSTLDVGSEDGALKINTLTNSPHMRPLSRKAWVSFTEQPTGVLFSIPSALPTTPVPIYSEHAIQSLSTAHLPIVQPTTGPYRFAGPGAISSGTKITKLAAMSNPERAVFYLLFYIGSLLTTLFGLWWFEPNHIAHNFSGVLHIADVVLFILLTYVVWYQLLNMIFSWYVAFHMKHPCPIAPERGLKVAFLTAFVPGKEPYDVLENTLQAMVAVDYPHETWLLDEGDDRESKRLCQKYGVKHYTRKGIAKYNQPDGTYKAKTKAGNYNSWYDQHAHRYEFVAQIDVDFIPKKTFLTRTLGYFRDPEVAFVGTPQIYGNLEESWVAKGAAEQAYAFYGPLQKGFFGCDMPLFIGANHIVRVQAHNSIDGYSGHIVEDHLTGMKFYANRWKSVYHPEILAIGEGPATWDAYFSQQMRWAYGLIDILFHQSPRLFRKMRLQHVLNYFFLQQYYFFGLAQVIGILLITLYFIFGIQSTAMSTWELLLLYPPLLIWQQVIFLWLQRFNIDPQNEKGLMLRGMFLNYAAWPIYFLAFIGVITGKRLTYKVTPKGKEQRKDSQFSLFIPHFILGTITALDIVASFFTHNQAPQLLFWAVLNSLAMYYFVSSVVLERFKAGRWLLKTRMYTISKKDTLQLPIVMADLLTRTQYTSTNIKQHPPGARASA